MLVYLIDWLIDWLVGSLIGRWVGREVVYILCEEERVQSLAQLLFTCTVLQWCVSVSLSCVEKKKISTNYRIVRGCAYKNGEPAIMMMQADNTAAAKSGKVNLPRTQLNEPQPHIMNTALCRCVHWSIRSFNPSLMHSINYSIHHSIIPWPIPWPIYEPTKRTINQSN